MRTKGFLIKISWAIYCAWGFYHLYQLWNYSYKLLSQIDHCTFGTLPSVSVLTFYEPDSLDIAVLFVIGLTTAPPCNTLLLLSSILAWFLILCLSQFPPVFSFAPFSCPVSKYWNLLVFYSGFVPHNFSSSHLIHSQDSTYRFLTHSSQIYVSSTELSLEFQSCRVYRLLDILPKSTHPAAILSTSGPKSKALLIRAWQTFSSSSHVPSLGGWHQVRHIMLSLSLSSVPYIN